MKQNITRFLLPICIAAFSLTAAGCSSRPESDKNVPQGQNIQASKPSQDGEQSHTVTAAYDENLHAILGEDGLIYEVLEEDDAPSMTVAVYNDVELDEITIPDTVNYEDQDYTVTQIKPSAFESNILLRKITLPQGMKTVGDSAFYACPELTEVVFSDTVTKIEANCFAECPKLSQIELPLSLEYLGAEVFSNCVSLQKITIPAKTATIGNLVFYGCESLTECIFEEGVTQIAAEMFTNCYELRNVSIPASLTSIGDEAFWACTSLTELVLPETVITIGSSPFYSSGITKLTICAESVQPTENLLRGCDELKELYVAEMNISAYYSFYGNQEFEIQAVK